MNLDLLKKYKAKYDNEISIYEHNNDLKNILEQIKGINSISDELYCSILNCINYHDLGKVHSEFQNKENINDRNVRHEILSASYDKLDFKERLAILLHHRDVDTLSSKHFKRLIYYSKYKKELEDELDIKTIDITDTIKTLKSSLKNKELLSNKDLILLKGYLQFCDHVASAGIKEIDRYIDTNESFIFKKYNSIQNKVRHLIKTEDIIVQAPTGLGKSATSMFWSDLVQNQEKSKRIYYILPYTASINSMYKEFKNRGISTGMLHSKAEYFLSKELDDGSEEKNYKSEYNLFKKSIKQVTISTIYQLIKFIFSCKNFEMLLAQLKDSIFIIDEIHCFDTEQLAILLTSLKFLKNEFGIRICVMSASIPTCLSRLIKEELSINTVIRADKEDLLIRHKVNHYSEFLENNIGLIENELRQGKQVLLCVNSVVLAQKLYDIFENRNINLKMIHGKYNMRDREQIEQDLQGIQLLIGTQSIEVSLDISYDVMFTEIAPLDSLLQRFGRVNRKGDKGISEIHIFKDSSNIYSEKIIRNTENVIKEIIEIDDRIVYEEKVNYYLDKVYIDFDFETYNKMKNKILNELINEMKVGYYNKTKLENLGMGESIYVLPDVLLNEYKKYIEKNDYLKANALFVSLTKKQFLFCRIKDHVKFDDKNEIYVTSLEYNKKGLIIYKLQ